MALQQIHARYRVLHLSEPDGTITDAHDRLAALNECLNQHPVAGVVPKIADRSAAADPGHAGESDRAPPDRVPAGREIIPNFLALLRTRIAVLNELTQARGLFRKLRVLVDRVQLRRNGFVTLPDRGIAHFVIPLALRRRKEVASQARDPFGDLQRVQRLVGERSHHRSPHKEPAPRRVP